MKYTTVVEGFFDKFNISNKSTEQELFNTLRVYLQRPSSDGRQPERSELRRKLQELLDQVDGR